MPRDGGEPAGGITDVTERVRKATAGLQGPKDGQKYNEAEKAELSKIEKECATSDDVRCDVVSLYRGGIYNLYKYQRYQDVRLVFAPELAIAFFGGDPDNFNFPRYDLDVSFVRVYRDGKPAKMDHYLKWSAGGAKDGEVTFVSGHPGGTSRLLTVAQLENIRDVTTAGAAAAPVRDARRADRIPAARAGAEAHRRPPAVRRGELPQGASAAGTRRWWTSGSSARWWPRSAS